MQGMKRIPKYSHSVNIVTKEEQFLPTEQNGYLDSVTAYATGGFKTIVVKTPGGSIHVALIRNQFNIVIKTS